MFGLKYVPGAIPGKAKRKATSSDNVDNEHKTKVKRNFVEKWKAGRPWLTYDSDKNKMFCNLCITHKDSIMTPNMAKLVSHSFINGTDNFKISTITDHESASGHIKAIQFNKAQTTSAETSNAGRALLSMKEKDRSRLRILFRNAHAVARHNRPLRDYAWLAKLDKAKKLDIGETYLNPMACGSFVDSIAKCTLDHTFKTLSNSSFFSLTMDGTTDISTTEQESIYVRSVKDGVITSNFLHIVEPDNTTGQGLASVIQKALSEIEKVTTLKKFVGFASDGASNMIGCRKGAATLLKQEFPSLQVVHCLSHRLELAYKDALKGKIKSQYEKTLTLLVGLYYFYKRSSLQRSSLKRTFKALDMKVVVPNRISGTRWLAHMVRSLDHTLSNFVPLTTHLASAAKHKPKAAGFHKMLVSAELLVFMIFLRDALEPLQTLSEWMQKRDATLADVHLRYESALSSLLDVKGNSSELQEVLESPEYKGVRLSGRRPQMAYKEGVVDEIHARLLVRFSDLADDRVVKSTRIASLHLWPAKRQQGFGNEEVKALFSHFSDRLDTEADSHKILREWAHLQVCMYTSYGTDVAKQKWEDVHQAMRAVGADNILLLMDLVFALPPTSVENERAFSQLKLLKTDRRHRLGQGRLDCLLQIRLNGSDIEEFNPDPAIDHWMVVQPTNNCRRMNYKRQPKIANVPEAETDADCTTTQVTRPRQSLVQHQDRDDSEVAVDEDEDIDESSSSVSDAESGLSFTEEDYQTNCINLAKFLEDFE